MENIGTKKISSLLFEYSVPAIMGMLVFALYNIVDRIFIGRGIGAYAMAGLSITFPLFTIYIAVGMLIGFGGGALVSLKLGANKKKDAEVVLGNVITLFTIFSIVLMIFGGLFLNKILILFGATENTIVYASEYMSIVNKLVFFNFLGMGLNNIIRAEGNPKRGMIYMILGAVINIILDPIFIFTFDMGIKGAAYATALSNVVSSVLTIYHFMYSKKSNIKLKLKNLKLNKKITKEIFSIGFSPFILQLGASLTAIVLNKTLLSYSNDLAVGAMGIINSVYMFISLIITGLIQGAQPIIGYNYAAKKYDRVKQTLKLSLRIAIGLSVILTGLIFSMPHFFINLFSNGNEQLLFIGSNGIKIYLSFMIFNSIYIIGSNYFQAIGNSKLSTKLNLLRQIVVFLPLLFILPKVLGLNGVWMAAPVSDLIVGVFTFLALKKKLTFVMI